MPKPVNTLANAQAKWLNPTEAMKKHIHTCITLRRNYPGGFGTSNPSHKSNRARLIRDYRLKGIQWLKQIHKKRSIKAPSFPTPTADAAWTKTPHFACAALTADCLPVFFTNDSATQVAVAHAGWRGLAAGILESVISSFHKEDKIHAAFGPAISKDYYEVGQEFVDAFPQHIHSSCFHSAKSASNAVYADLYAIAAKTLENNNIAAPPIPKWCTYKDKDLFPSYRRDNVMNNNHYDRIANLIWIA